MNYIFDHKGKPYRKFFEEIAAIPHESFHEKELSDYIAAFARERGLEYYQDDIWNVIIKKPASPGYEDHDPVMIQGHIDMVCVKTPESDHNFQQDPLQLYVEDGFLRAKDTTLGADCGHGISYMLAILDDRSLEHPPLECLFTVQEEVGVGGPKHLDYSPLTAKRLIFTDSMGEGKPELSTTSVLGGNFIKKAAFLPVPEGWNFFRLTAGGLAGGHAAVDINKGRGNAVKILARAAARLMKDAPLRICSFEGGTLKNNIPDKGELIFAAPAQQMKVSEPANPEDMVKLEISIKPEEAANPANQDQTAEPGTAIEDVFQHRIKDLEQAVRQEHEQIDPSPFLKLEPARQQEMALSAEDSKDVIYWLMEIPTGTYLASPEDPSFPITSRNLGTCNLTGSGTGGLFTIGYMIRTSMKSHTELLFEEQRILADLFGAKWEKEYDYPGYRTEPGGPMYRVYEQVYRELTGKELEPIHIHAGTDVGTIIERMGGMDVIGIGPNTYKFHTPEEALDLASYDRAYGYIVEVLKRL